MIIYMGCIPSPCFLQFTVTVMITVERKRVVCIPVDNDFVFAGSGRRDFE